MRALIDTCVVIDALQSRIPFSKAAEDIFLLSANKAFNGYITAKAVTDIYYLTHRCVHDHAEARSITEKLCILFNILDTTSGDVQRALASDISDYEDAVMIETAIREKVDCIVTRNAHDYRLSPVAVYSPEEFVAIIASEQNN